MVFNTRKILLSVLGFLTVGFLATAGFVYLQISDVEKIKERVVAKLESATGRKIVIEGAELDFIKGLSIKLRNVAIGVLPDGRPELQADSIWVVTRILPLLKQQVEIEKLIVKGSSLLLVRDVEGNFNFRTVRDDKAVSVDNGVFDILQINLANQLVLEEGEIEFLDYYKQEGREPLSLSISKYQLSVRKKLLKADYNFSMSGEIPIVDVAPTRFSVSGTFDNPGKSGSLLSVPVNAQVKVEDLSLPSIKPFFLKAAFQSPGQSRISLESTFTGSLTGPFQSTGSLKFHAPQPQGPALRDMDSQHRGALDYDLAYTGNSVDVKSLKVQSGPFESSFEGAVTRLDTGDPDVSFSLRTSPFLLDKKEDYFPLMIFPQGFHDWINGLFQHGKVEIKSFAYDGTLARLKSLSIADISSQVSGEFVLSQVDWRSPLPPLTRVNGSLTLLGGVGKVLIDKAHYEELTISDITGQIEYLPKGPVAELSVENKVDLPLLRKTLVKILSETQFKSLIDDYTDIRGEGVVRVDFKGSLDDPSQLSLSARLSLDNISLYEEELRHRIENLKGEVRYQHIPDLEEKSKKAWVPFFEFKNFSGNFGKSSFANLEGAVALEKGEPMRKMTGLYTLNAMELPGLIQIMDYDSSLVNVLKKTQFLEGDVKVSYNAKENMKSPDSLVEWGQIGLTRLSMKYPEKFKPLLNVSGNLAFGDKKLRLENISGWYGDSPVQFGGEIVEGERNAPTFSLRAVSSDFKKVDLMDMPFLDKLDFSGPVQTSLRLDGTQENFRFRHEVDLTRTAYKWGESFVKPGNAPNQAKIWGHYAQKKGFVVEGLEYEIGGNKITGQGTLESFDKPVFSVELKTEAFKVYPVAQFFSPFKSNQDGGLDFRVQGNGNLSQFDQALFKGKIRLKRLVFKPENQSGNLIVNADIGFKGDRFDIQNAKLITEQSDLLASGVYQAGDQPVLDLRLYGKQLCLDELMDSSGQGKGGIKDLLDRAHIFSHGEMRVAVNLSQLDYKFIKLKHVAGNLSFRDDVVNVGALKVGAENPILVRGSLSVKDSEPHRFKTHIQAKNTTADSLTLLFGDTFGQGLSGNLKELDILLRGEGNNWGQIRHTLEGTVAMHLTSGELDQGALLLGAQRIFGLPQTGTEKKPDEPTRTTYDQISGHFTLKGGVAQTENFVYGTSERRMSMVGVSDFGKNSMDMVLGVALLPQLDKFLTRIPLVGKIITGGDEKSLVKNYYTVKGPFSNLEITTVPFTALGKKVLGIFQGIFQAPQELFPFYEPKGTN